MTGTQTHASTHQSMLTSYSWQLQKVRRETPKGPPDLSEQKENTDRILLPIPWFKIFKTVQFRNVFSFLSMETAWSLAKFTMMQQLQHLGLDNSFVLTPYKSILELSQKTFRVRYIQRSFHQMNPSYWPPKWVSLTPQTHSSHLFCSN